MHDLIPQKTVTLFSGDGGTGKSLLSLQLAVGVVTGRGWIGKAVSGGSVIYMSAEDDDDEGEGDPGGRVRPGLVADPRPTGGCGGDRRDEQDAGEEAVPVAM